MLYYPFSVELVSCFFILKQDKKQKSSDKKTGVLTIRKPPSRSSTAKIWEMEDQLVMAKAYVHFSSSNSNTHLVRELKLRIKEIDRVLSHANKDSDLFTRYLIFLANCKLEKVDCVQSYLLNHYYGQTTFVYAQWVFSCIELPIIF